VCLFLAKDVLAKDKDGFTDLMLACKEKKEEAAALLTDATNQKHKHTLRGKK